MTPSATNDQVSVSRIVDLDIEQAFDAWLDPAVIPCWWGPEGYRTTVETLDAQVGGSFRFRMTAPSGNSCPMTGTYTRIDRPTALDFDVHDHCVADIPADIDPPTQPSKVQVRLEDLTGKTRITVSQIGLSADYQTLARVGWGDSLERLTVSQIPKDQ